MADPVAVSDYRSSLSKTLSPMDTWIGVGTLRQPPRTPWEYGPYLLEHPQNPRLAALRAGRESGSVDHWVDKWVYVKGCLLHEGVSGGPPYVELIYCSDDAAGRGLAPDCTT
ncbi:MAG: hypothetical protein AABM30_03125 [Actinomycetota bacterium]